MTSLRERGDNIQIEDSSSGQSDDDYSTKVKLVKLNRHNWHDWTSRFEHLLIGKGHEEILDRKWIEDHKGTKTYRKKNSYALSLLYQAVERDLQSEIKSSRNDFTSAYQSLARACGEKSWPGTCSFNSSIWRTNQEHHFVIMQPASKISFLIMSKPSKVILPSCDFWKSLKAWQRFCFSRVYVTTHRYCL